MKVTEEFHWPIIILHKLTPRLWQKVVTSCFRHDARPCKSPNKTGTSPNVSNTSASGRAWLQMDYFHFQELWVNEMLANHATPVRREKTAGQVTVLFILLPMDNNRKIYPSLSIKIGTIVPIRSKRKGKKKILISSNVIQFQEIWPITREAILH